MTPAQSAAIRQILAAQFARSVDSIAPTMTLDDLDCDSLDCIEIIMTIEDEFGIDIDDEKLAAAGYMTVEQFEAAVDQFLPRTA